MSRISDFFEFSPAQYRFLLVLCAAAALMAVFLLVRSLASPDREAPDFSLFLADAEVEYTGLVILDPNTAPADSLELLPGIGKVLADRIVAYRQHHRFERPVDLTEVKGIGPKLFERLRNYIRIKQP